MQINRRDALNVFFASAAACALPVPALSESITQRTPAAAGLDPRWRHFTLANGFRTHLFSNDSGYVSASLLLRSDQITFENGGLAHIMEHSSFVGAAGDLSAKDLKNLYKDVIQDSNASTATGAIEWNVSFLPQSLAEALRILSITSLDQKFDEETVKSEAKVVLQELYLDKYGKAGKAQKRFNSALYGKGHPYARDTTEKEIAKAKTAPAELAAELRLYAKKLKLPANMDLFLVGDLDPVPAEHAVGQSFGDCPHARGPTLELPRVGLTRSYHALTGPAYELARPMTELVFAWNTGVSVTDGDARVLKALREYVDCTLFLRLREEHGDTYTPEVEYEPDSCSGAFKITITSSTDPAKVERRVFDAIEAMKSAVDAREIARFKHRVELKRRKNARDNKALLECMVNRTIDGASADDLEIETVTPDEILAAARKYLPSHKGAYVRLALHGQ